MTSLLDKLALSLKEDGSDANLKQWAIQIRQNSIPLMELTPLLHQPHPIGMRFIWLVGGLCESDPARVVPAIPYFYAVRHTIRFPNFDRSLAKMFWLCGIPGEVEGEVTDELFRWVLDPKVSVSTKNYALSALYDLCVKHPDLSTELKAVIEDQLGKNLSSFDKRAGKILGKLQ